MTQVFPLSIAQVTDIHLFADEDQELLGLPTQQSFQAVIERLNELRPQLDLLLLTGDLSQDGMPESYERLQNLLNPLQLRTYWLPGNHDCPSTMEQVLNCELLSPSKAFEVGGWNFILLNSGVAGCVHGYLSAQTLNWLDVQLKTLENKPTLVGLHHPPFQVNSDWLDTSSLQNPEELFAILDRYPQVKLVLFGHIHQEFHQERNRVHYLGSPSSSIQFERESSNFALGKEPPGFRLLSLYPDGTWETHIERVAYTHYLDLAATGY
jgi:Icc protein